MYELTIPDMKCGCSANSVAQMRRCRSEAILTVELLHKQLRMISARPQGQFATAVTRAAFLPSARR